LWHRDRMSLTNELTELPESFEAGTTVSYRKAFSSYPASEWTLTLYLAGASVTEIEATPDSDDFVVTISPAGTSGSFVDGVYEWVERVSKGDEVYTVDSGVVHITPNLAEAAPGDRQSWLERSIVVLKAHVEGRMTAGMESYSIAGRAVSKMPIKDAVSLLTSLEARLARLQQPSKVSRSVLVQFTSTGMKR